MELGSRIYSIESEIALMKSDMILIKSKVTSMKSDMISTNSTLESVPRNVYIFFHNFNGGKVDVLSQSMSAMMICDNKITVPYVLLNDRVFGLTVAHTPCTWKQAPPHELIACPNLDVSLMKTCPPARAGILNITGSVTFAPVGDQVMSCGFLASGATRCWFGTVAGKTEEHPFHPHCF